MLTTFNLNEYVSRALKAAARSRHPRRGRAGRPSERELVPHVAADLCSAVDR